MGSVFSRSTHYAGPTLICVVRYQPWPYEGFTGPVFLAPCSDAKTMTVANVLAAARAVLPPLADDECFLAVHPTELCAGAELTHTDRTLRESFPYINGRIVIYIVKREHLAMCSQMMLVQPPRATMDVLCSQPSPDEEALEALRIDRRDRVRSEMVSTAVAE